MIDNDVLVALDIAAPDLLELLITSLLIKAVLLGEPLGLLLAIPHDRTNQVIHRGIR